MNDSIFTPCPRLEDKNPLRESIEHGKVDRGKRNMTSRILHKTTAIYILILALGALFGVLLLRSDEPSIVAGDTTFRVRVADTAERRQQGLSGTPRLAKGTGELFIFPASGKHGFWMKDMAYPIDIIWIDQGWKVVDIADNVTPDSYPRVFYPAVPAQYVLEVNASEVDNSLMGTILRYEK